MRFPRVLAEGQAFLSCPFPERCPDSSSLTLPASGATTPRSFAPECGLWPPSVFRTEIQRRIARIELVFMPDRLGVAAIIHYTNGVLATTMIFGREVDRADLRARGLARIERSLVKAES